MWDCIEISSTFLHNGGHMNPSSPVLFFQHYRKHLFILMMFFLCQKSWSAEGILDYERFRTQIEPLLLTQTYNSPSVGVTCYSCHGSTSNAGYTAFPLNLGQTRRNYIEAARQVTLDEPDTSLLLLKPLAVAAGGVPHGLLGNDGGEQFSNTTTDANYSAILDWIIDATQASQGARVSKTHPYPNPFRTKTNIVYFLTSTAEKVDVRIFTYNGTEVRQYEGTTNIGANQVEWDGRATDLEPLATGVYFYSIKARFEDGTFIKTGRCVYAP